MYAMQIMKKRDKQKYIQKESYYERKKNVLKERQRVKKKYLHPELNMHFIFHSILFFILL